MKVASVIFYLISGLGLCIKRNFGNLLKETNYKINRENAVLLILCRERDLPSLLRTLSQIENRFNSKYNYPYVFLNNGNFSVSFKSSVRSAINPQSSVKFGFIDPFSPAWSYPPYVNTTIASYSRERMRLQRVQYGHNEQYHFMCRYFSGYFYDHPLVLKYEYFWRIEPHVEFLCNIDIDPFKILRRRQKIYGYVLMHREIMATIPSLWNATSEFMSLYASTFTFRSKLMDYFLGFLDRSYNGCHFWSNFEIASFTFFRSKEYRAYFQFLDEKGGFFYERWGDAPVHSLALAMFLRPRQVLQFDDIAYRHGHLEYCPVKLYVGVGGDKNCTCRPNIASQLSLTACKILSSVAPPE